MYFVYMLRCRGGSLYTGIAADMEKRLRQHASGGAACAKYTRAHPPEALAALYQAEDHAAAARLEALIEDASAHKKALSGRRTDSAGGCFRREAERPFISPLFRRGIAFERAAGYAVTAARPRCAGPIFSD